MSPRATAASALAAGVLLGVVGTLGGLRLKFRGFRDSGKRHERMLERFGKELQLDAEQKTKVGAILEEKRKKLEALRAEGKPKFEAIKDSTRAEIRALLTPEQQASFDRFEQKLEKRRARWKGRGSGSPRGP